MPYCMPSPLQEPAATAAGESPQLSVAQFFPGPHSFSIRSVSKSQSLLGPPLCSKSVKINRHLLREQKSPTAHHPTSSLVSHHIRREVTLPVQDSVPALCSALCPFLCPGKCVGSVISCISLSQQPQIPSFFNPKTQQQHP